jgi:hypothetical protein
MKSYWVKEKLAYTGEQLAPLFAYLNYQVLGPSVIAFRGPCEVTLDHMVDGEDVLAQASIRGSDMLHFIIEIFDHTLFSGVLLQRLFATTVLDYLREFGKGGVLLRREGDDLYLANKKLSISIATRSTSSILIHFAVNISNQGTPVPTLSLEDLEIDPEHCAQQVMRNLVAEYEDVLKATYKVRSV